MASLRKKVVGRGYGGKKRSGTSKRPNARAVERASANARFKRDDIFTEDMIPGPKPSPNRVPPGTSRPRTITQRDGSSSATITRNGVTAPAIRKINVGDLPQSSGTSSGGPNVIPIGKMTPTTGSRGTSATRTASGATSPAPGIDTRILATEIRKRNR